MPFTASPVQTSHCQAHPIVMGLQSIRVILSPTIPSLSFIVASTPQFFPFIRFVAIGLLSPLRSTEFLVNFAITRSGFRRKLRGDNSIHLKRNHYMGRSCQPRSGEWKSAHRTNQTQYQDPPY